MTASRFRIKTTGIISSEAKGGEVRLQLGDPGNPEGGLISDAPVWGIDGFLSRPNPPDADGQCAIAMSTAVGSQTMVIGTKDNRYVEAVGELLPGDRAIVTNADARFFIKQATSAVIAYTVNQKSDESMIVELSGEDGEIRLFNGLAGIILRDDGTDQQVLITMGASTILLDADGIFINGAHFGCNTNGGNFGTLGPAPPLPPAFSVLIGPTGMAGLPSLKFTMAP